MKIKIIITMAVLLLILIGIVSYIIIANNSKESQINTGNQQNPTATDSASKNSIDISNFKFSPLTLTIKEGENVTWTNKDSAKHTITSDSGNELDSTLLSKMESYSHTFNTKGEFAYHCTPHPYMTGKIIVQ